MGGQLHTVGRAVCGGERVKSRTLCASVRRIKDEHGNAAFAVATLR